MTAADRLAALDGLNAVELCTRAADALADFAEMMNRETTLLRAGRFAEAAPLASAKAELAQSYVGLARTVQRHADRLKAEAPEQVERLRSGHERLATQMAENLRVLATARTVTEDILSDAAARAGRNARPRVYGATGRMGAGEPGTASGLAVNRSL
jgi:hypothetical protein